MKGRIKVRARVYAFQHETSGRIRKARHTSRRDALRYLTEVLEPFWTPRQVRLIWVEREAAVYGAIENRREDIGRVTEPPLQERISLERKKAQKARDPQSEAVDLAAETGWMVAVQ